MNRKATIVIILQAVLIVVLFWALVYFARDEYEARQRDHDLAGGEHVVARGDEHEIHLSGEAQRQGGIATSELKAATYRGSIAAFGSVIGIEPLLELRSRYLTAVEEVRAGSAARANSHQDYERLLGLNRDNRNISDRAVQAAEAVWRSDEAKLVGAESRVASLREIMRQQWGESITKWAVEQPPPDALQRLIDHRDALLQISLPFDTRVSETTAGIFVEPIGSSGQAVGARYVSPSPQAGTLAQGRSFFYRASGENLRVGMRITGRLRGQGEAASGVVVPAAAVVWYAGKAWVYEQEDDDHFVRRPITTEHETGDGWFNSGTLEAGDRVVTSGAQLLLSEEFKYQIKNENED